MFGNNNAPQQPRPEIPPLRRFSVTRVKPTDPTQSETFDVMAHMVEIIGNALVFQTAAVNEQGVPAIKANRGINNWTDYLEIEVPPMPKSRILSH